MNPVLCAHKTSQSVWLCYFQFYCCSSVYSHFKNRSVCWNLISTKTQMWFSNFDHRNVARSAAEIRYFFCYWLTSFDLNITYVKMTSHQPKYKQRIRFEILLQLTHLEFVFFLYFHWLPKVDLHAISRYFILFSINFIFPILKMLILRVLNLIFNFLSFLVFINKPIQYGWWRSKIFI